jgi:hypothetical protein
MKQQLVKIPMQSPYIKAEMTRKVISPPATMSSYTNVTFVMAALLLDDAERRMLLRIFESYANRMSLQANSCFGI